MAGLTFADIDHGSALVNFCAAAQVSTIGSDIAGAVRPAGGHGVAPRRQDAVDFDERTTVLPPRFRMSPVALIEGVDEGTNRSRSLLG